jgi:uncharacterized protein (DUF952 family)
MAPAFCPVPHSTRDQVWLGVGILAGAGLMRVLLRRLADSRDEPSPEPLPEPPLVQLSPTISGRPQAMTPAVPTRVFKLAVKSEVDAFIAAGKIESTLDKQDGFIHLSDKTSPVKVAALFFKEATDLHLIEIDATKLSGPVQWVLGKMGEDPPPTSARLRCSTTVHYLVADGCVHVYGGAVEWSAVTRPPEHLPLGADGKHVMPAWL